LFSFFKKSPPAGAGLENLGCDMHSHLIPGIDDGSPDMETSLRLIRGLSELGYHKLITTPHINTDHFRNTPEIILGGRDRVIGEIRERGLTVEFAAAAEYLIDDGFTANLAHSAGLAQAAQPQFPSFLPLKDNLILVELSFVVPAINLKQVVFDLQLKGYQPVLAHPERYVYFAGNKGWYDQLRDAGCLFQLNLLSFIGHYGREVRALADHLIKKKYVDYLGTDLHHERHLELLRSSPALGRIVGKLLDTGLIRNPQL
jgi:tyrosine-protein phosphatase YwqE